MASTGINDIQPLGTAEVTASRLSRESHRRHDDSIPESPSLSDDKKLSDENMVATMAYDSDEKRRHKEGLVEDEDFEPYDVHSGQPFALADLPEEEGDGLTARALIVGTLLGLVIAASNVYLGLKTGWTFGSALFGALLGCAIIKAVTRISFPARMQGGFWGLGQPFGPRENVTVQSAATASGSLTGMFVAAIPAAAQLGLLNSPTQDFGRLITFSLCSAYYGVFFAIPLRKFYILRQRLVFPSATATALTIRALHAKNGAADMKKKTRCLLIAFICAFVFVVVQQYAPGILQEWHFFYWIYLMGGKSAIIVDCWNWYMSLTPAFFGAGILSGMNASYSFLLGAFLAWGIIGPATVSTGITKGAQSEIEPLVWSYNSMRVTSPRYWLMWVGVSMMMFYSFAELAVTGPAIYRAMRRAVVNVYRTARKMDLDEDSEELDPAPKDQQVQGWSWTSGWLLSSVVTILVCSLQFHMNAGNVVLSIVLAFIFAFIGVSSSGTTDINPLGTIAKMSQLVVGGALKAEGKTGPPAQLENLLAGSIASSAAAHAVDMIGDLKTGHLVRASPRTQYYAQLFGSLWAIPFSVAMYVLFASAYPCVVDGELFNEGDCPFQAPAVAAWKSVSVAVTTPNAIPFVSGMVAIGLGIFSAAIPFVKHWFIPAKHHNKVPNFNAVGLAFVLPQVYYPIIMCIGATFSLVWARKNLRSWDTYAYVLAAGLVCGEGLAGVFNAVLEIAGVSGSFYGTAVGLPAFF